jgi:hypothetical protein
MATYDDATRVQSAPQMPGKPMATPINRDQRTAIVAAGGGTAALGGAAYALSRLEDSDNADLADANGNGIPDDQEKPVVAPTPAPEPVVAQVITPPITDANGDGIDDSLQTNTDGLGGDGTDSLGDDDTFDKAFAEARAAQGPGHAFEWHGNLYSTYFEEEWDDMDKGERNVFYASVGIDLPGGNDGAAGAAGGGGSHGGGAHGGGAEAYAANDIELAPEPADDATAMIPDKDATDGITVIAENDPDSSPVTAEANADDAVIMLDPDAQDPDSVPVVATNDDPSVSVITVEGHQMALIDTDHDNQADMMMSDDNVVLIDTDGDHKFDTQATYNPETHQVENVQTLDNQLDSVAMNEQADDIHLADNSHNMDMGMDFNSHADVSDFAL